MFLALRHQRHRAASAVNQLSVSSPPTVSFAAACDSAAVVGSLTETARQPASRGVSLSVNDAASMPGAAASATSTTDYARINFGSFDSQGSASSDAKLASTNYSKFDPTLPTHYAAMPLPNGGNVAGIGEYNNLPTTPAAAYGGAEFVE